MRFGFQVDTNQSINVRLTPVSILLKLAAWDSMMGAASVQPPRPKFCCLHVEGLELQDCGVNSTHNFILATKNMRSATLSPQVIEEYIKQESEFLFQSQWHQLFIFKLIGLV